MSPRVLSAIRRAAAIAVAAVALAACTIDAPKDLKPVSSALKMKMEQLGMSEIAPIFIRIFKEESEFEVWKQRNDGKYALLQTYSICKWSGDLGPKKAEGDRQAPEGFYTVTPAQMNPNSSYYLSFDIGYPNTFDRALGRSGANLMVHGACSSRGCYSMTDEVAGEIFALARDSFRGGQRSFELEAFPFRMTPENMARHRDNPNITFWKMLKEGYDHFEVTQVPPKVDVCGKRYVFDADANGGRFTPAAACPAFTVPEPIRVAVAAKQESDEAAYKTEVARLEQEDAKKAAEEARRQQADAQRIAEMERREQERAARPAEKATANAGRAETAEATPAALAVAEDEGTPAAEKKSRFGFIKRLFNRNKGAEAPQATALVNGSDFDAGTASPIGVPVPVPRPANMAKAPAKTPVRAEAAPPAPPKQAEAAPASPPRHSGGAEAAERPSAPMETATPKPPAEAVTPPSPATAASTRPPAATTGAPLAPAPEKKKPEEKNFDDVFG